MARSGPAVAPPLILPDPPAKYDQIDQRETRRLIKDNVNARQTTDFAALVTVPPPVSALATVVGAAANTISYFTSATAMAVTSFTAFARSLLAAATATAARVVLNIVEHQSSVTQVTGSLANLATENGILLTPDLVCRLLSVTVDRGCWITLYSSVAARSSDSTRAATTLPTAGTGVLAEFQPTLASTIPCGPVPVLANGDGAGGIASVAQVYYRIQNKSGATSTVSVTFNFGAAP